MVGVEEKRKKERVKSVGQALFIHTQAQAL